MDWHAKFPIAAFFPLLLFAILPWSLISAFEEAERLSFVAFDIGQGDAIWVETPDHYQMLVDGGPTAAVLEKISSRLPFWDRSIDLIILTHPHADHLAGLVDVLERYEVGAVIESMAPYGTAEYAEWERRLAERGIPRYRAGAGMEVALGAYAELSILSPTGAAGDKPVKNVHDLNVVSELAFGETRFLLTGDAEARLERLLLASGSLSGVSVLKVGHHGSKTSSSDVFLSVVKPEFAVVSAGKKNRYGHPAKEVLDRIERAGVRILRTDLLGDVVLESDGRDVFAP